MKMVSSFLSIITAAGSLFAADFYPQELTQDSLLLNPGKGWILHGKLSWVHSQNKYVNNKRNYDPTRTYEQTSNYYSNVGYHRLSWCSLEPSEGQFEFTGFDRIDYVLDQYKAENKQMAIAVMPADAIDWMGRQYITPEWVFTDPQTGAERCKKYPAVENGDTCYIPENWNDAYYLARVDTMIRKLAERYDGDPSIAWVEVRSYGNFGEGHLWGWLGEPNNNPGIADLRLNIDQLYNEHASRYRKYFKKTPILACETYLREDFQKIPQISYDRYIDVQKIGVRDDGILHEPLINQGRDGSTVAPCDGKVPSAFELARTYRSYPHETAPVSFADTLKTFIKRGRVYYSTFGRTTDMIDIDQYLDDIGKDTLSQIGNYLGYHISVTQMGIPSVIKNSVPFDVSLSWKNRGVARLWFPVTLKLALINSSNQVVKEITLNNSKIRSDLYGIDNPLGANTLAELFSDNTISGISAGNYRVALGLISNTKGNVSGTPDIQLANVCEKVDNWHIIGSTKVESDNSTTVYSESFSSGWNGWNHYQHSSADASAKISYDNVMNSSALVTRIRNVGTEPWHIHVKKSGIALVSGKRYRLSFRAHTEKDQSRSINAMLIENGGAYQVYGFNKFNINSTVSTCSFEFVSSTNNNDACISIDMGNINTPYGIDVMIDDIKLEKLN